MKSKIYCVYPAVLQYNDGSDGLIDIFIPDFHIYTKASNELDALIVIKKEIINGLEKYKESGKHFPYPTPLENLETMENEKTTLVEIDLA